MKWEWNFIQKEETLVSIAWRSKREAAHCKRSHPESLGRLPEYWSAYALMYRWAHGTVWRENTERSAGYLCAGAGMHPAALQSPPLECPDRRLTRTSYSSFLCWGSQGSPLCKLSIWKERKGREKVPECMPTSCPAMWRQANAREQLHPAWKVLYKQNFPK